MKHKLPTMKQLVDLATADAFLTKQVHRVATTIKDGWTTYEKAMTMAGAVLLIKPKTAIEIGVWSGKALIPIAAAIKENGHGTAYGIDPFSTAASAEGQTGEHLDWWSKVDHDSIHKKLIDNISSFGVKDVALLIRKRSDDVEPFESQLLTIDGNHGDQAIRDVARFASRVSVGGIVFLDDLEWVGSSGASVLTSILVLEAMGFKECFRYKTDADNWGCWIRTSKP